MKLYSYWRSTTSLRVRAVLNLKGIAYETVPINLLQGKQKAKAYAAINPSLGVPSLELADGTVLTQSHAIIAYLDAVYPDPSMLPDDPVARAKSEAASCCIAMDIHPVNNLRVGAYLKTEMGQDQSAVVDWMNHWMTEGFMAFQTLIDPKSDFAFGDAPSLPDICLVGQMVNARRWGMDLSRFGRLVEIDARAKAIDAIKRAMPEHQPDADPTP